MLRPRKFTAFAMMAAVLATGCGRYEGIPEPAFQSTLDIKWDEPTDTDRSEHPDERTLRVFIRDVEPRDLYDENCRVMGPPNGVADPFTQSSRSSPLRAPTPSRSAAPLMFPPRLERCATAVRLQSWWLRCLTPRRTALG